HAAVGSADRCVPALLLRRLPPLPRRLRSAAAGARAAESGADRVHGRRTPDCRSGRLRHTISRMKRLLFLACVAQTLLSVQAQTGVSAPHRSITEKDLF